MGITRRGFIGGTGAAGGGLLAVACGADGGTASPPAADLTKKETKLTFMFWAPRVDTFQNSAKGFNQRFPKVQIELLQQPSDFHPKLQAMVAAGNPPETWALELQKTQSYARMGAAAPLSSYYKRDRQVRKEDLPELKQKQLSDTKGEIYGTSPNMSGNFIHYNLDLFRQAGLPDPYDLWKQDRWTWDAFLTAVRQLTKRTADGKATQIGSSAGIHRLWMNANGVEEFDSFVAPTKVNYDRPEAIDALSWLADLRLKQQVFVTSAQNELGYRDTRDAFKAGKVAMADFYISEFSLLADISTFSWAVVPYPKKKDYVIDSSGSGLAMSKANKELDVSWEWIKFGMTREGSPVEADNLLFVVEPEGQKRYIENLKKITSMTHQDTIAEAFKKYGRSRLLSVNEPELSKIINDGIAPLWKGEQPAPTVARDITTRANEFIKANPQ
ncbi:MAG: hypothetical protein AVDCRST_MAG77-5783 [uncultured Chloroflexi bacterium]|uniref:ABC transporter, substrate-binding protein (Cluster 1, maltose/g3p/polyamine/iron) n=1 Tax=uncultured Chloroflexota bacterium TaxID=166587 RepID=A0A6J4KE55_9CHLR|nr:MAG: hypothetical protein AVDCRST_MAG77-5783 [uncultured Chloroflexota bacterium]